jgi:AcrR family transcriptional regulator
MDAMQIEERQLRADAERNRRRLLETAEALFRERGLDVGVAEIAQAAGVGRGTLFRNFASKEDLIAAIVAEQMQAAAARGEELLDSADPAEALFEFLAEMVGRQQLNRSLSEAMDESWLCKEVIRPAHGRVVEVLERLLARAQEAGGIRKDIGAMDLLMMFKGACTAAATFGNADPAIIERHLDLIRASVTSVPGAPPLRGRSPTLEDLGIEGS